MKNHFLVQPRGESTLKSTEELVLSRSDSMNTNLLEKKKKKERKDQEMRMCGGNKKEKSSFWAIHNKNQKSGKKDSKGIWSISGPNDV